MTAWDERVRIAPDAPALRFFDTVLSAREVDSLVRGLAAALAERGIGPGDRVGVCLQNVPQYVVTLLALWRRGAAAALLNPMYRGEELRQLVDLAGPRGVVVDSAILGEVRPALEGSSVEWLWSTSSRDLGTGDERSLGSRPGPVDSDGDLLTLARTHDEVADEPTGPADVALLSFTSGTTGPAKAAMNTHGNLLAVADACGPWMDLGPDDVVLCVAPMFHITGSVITMTAPLLAGATVDLIGRTHPEAVRDALRDHGVTTTTGSITVFNGLARLEDLPPDTFAGVRHLFSGGAPVPPATVDRFAAEHGCYIHNIYGMTETSSAVIGVPPGERAPVDPGTGSLSIGRPLPGVEVRIAAPDGTLLGPGEPGELQVRGPSVIPGYWERPDATAETIVDGWLRTGDGAIVDADGWVHIVDRLKDQINVSGYKVWPREVEDALHRHPAVLEAAVVGAPDDYSGERVVAHVTRRPGADVDDQTLIAFVREHLAAYKVPRSVAFLDELPKTATGKIRRRDLRD